MSEVILDSNVLVGLLDRHDSLHSRANSLLQLIAEHKGEPLFLDFCVAEAVSVLCRRAVQRKVNPPQLGEILPVVRLWYETEQITFAQEIIAPLFLDVLNVVDSEGGALSFNDGFLVVLQKEGLIGLVATFDRGLAAVEGFRSVDERRGEVALRG